MADDGGKQFPENVQKLLDAGGPANPTDFPAGDGGTFSFSGLTIRDYFAAQAMGAIVGQIEFGDDDGETEIDFDAIAGDSYRVADAMLEARKR